MSALVLSPLNYLYRLYSARSSRKPFSSSFIFPPLPPTPHPNSVPFPNSIRKDKYSTTAAMSAIKLKVGAAGLGRMGARHALNFLNRSPRSELVAAFSPDPKEIAWARVHLEPHGVTLYDDYDKMLTHPGLQAVVIGTATSVHAEEAIKAMEKNLHVLCEKPLSTSVEIVSRRVAHYVCAQN